MNRLGKFLVPLALCLALAGPACADDVAVSAIASLINPAKLATLHGERAANQRVLKCVYWLNDVRSRGLKPEEVIVAAQALNQSAGQSRALLGEAGFAPHPEPSQRRNDGSAPVGLSREFSQGRFAQTCA